METEQAQELITREAAYREIERFLGHFLWDMSPTDALRAVRVALRLEHPPV